MGNGGGTNPEEFLSKKDVTHDLLKGSLIKKLQEKRKEGRERREELMWGGGGGVSGSGDKEEDAKGKK